MSALVGAVVAQGLDNAEAIRVVRPGCDIEAEWEARRAAGHDEYLDETDLYPDVRAALRQLKDAGLWVGVAGNQNLRAGECLRRLALPADGIVTSAEWGVAKPAAAFFEQLAAWVPAERDETVYVGDHPANDIVPARAAGFRTAHIRRGHIGLRTAHSAGADWQANSLTELAELFAHD
jgi:HAD superfamily hydrolase (TIGR01549 family)